MSVGGDFDKDGKCNNTDLVVFAADFGRTGCSGVNCPGDFNADGNVDGREIEAFITEFGRMDCL
nr:hypothetical protein [uncultured Desulfobacter sp.]